MPRQITETVYQYGELSDAAKSKARDWFRELEAQDFGSHGELYEDFEICAERLGIEFDRRDVPLMGGGKRSEPCIFWSGFCSQGDGACFEGRYTYRKASTKAVKDHAPKDKELQRIAIELSKLQRKHGRRLAAKVKHQGHYNHAYCTEIDTWYDHPKTGLACLSWERVPNAPDDAKALEQLLRDFMNWMYRQLEAEYNYRTGDEAVVEGIEANEYEFSVDGKRSVVIR